MENVSKYLPSRAIYLRGRIALGVIFILIVSLLDARSSTSSADPVSSCGVESGAEEIAACIQETAASISAMEDLESIEVAFTGQPEPPGSDRVYGGSVAPTADGIVSLYLTGEDSRGQRLSSRCTGSLIASGWILTAAHCMYFTDQNGNVISGVDGGFAAIGDKRVFGNPRREFSFYHVHPSYGFAKGQMANDLALIRLSRPVLGVPLMELAPAGARSMRDAGTGKEIQVWGYGQIDTSVLSDELMIGTLRITKDLPAFKRVFTTSTLNDAGAPSSVCPGDSGGPATIWSEDGKAILYGVSSFIFNDKREPIFCGKANNKSAFVDIVQYIPWIEKVISR